MNDRSAGGREGRISLRQIDRLLLGELPEAEAEALRAAIASSPEAAAYLERQSEARSRLRLEDLRAGGTPRGRESAAQPSLWNRLRQWPLLANPARTGLAFAGLVAVCAGLWSWNLGPGRGHVVVDETGYRSKGADTVLLRLRIRGVEYEPDQIATTASGDTLIIAYRSPFPVRAQVWYREDGGTVQAMTSPSSVMEWAAAPAWTQAPDRIVLEGAWRRQTVWVVWARKPFTAEDARRAVEGRGTPATIRTESFRLIQPR